MEHQPILKVSFDQGKHCGIVLWVDGIPDPEFMLTIDEPPSLATTTNKRESDLTVKTADMQLQCNFIIHALYKAQDKHGQFIRTVLLEDFEAYIPRRKLAAMTDLYLRTGILRATLNQNLSLSCEIYFLSKGSDPKMKAALVAKQLGFPELALPKNNHIADALYLGVLKGWSAQVR